MQHMISPQKSTSDSQFQTEKMKKEQTLTLPERGDGRWAHSGIADNDHTIRSCLEK
jgi:hypothetical protein